MLETKNPAWESALASSAALRALVLANGEEQIYLAWRLGHGLGKLEGVREAHASIKEVLA